jgi:hypothetical protein
VRNIVLMIQRLSLTGAVLVVVVGNTWRVADHYALLASLVRIAVVITITSATTTTTYILSLSSSSPQTRSVRHSSGSVWPTLLKSTWHV